VSKLRFGIVGLSPGNGHPYSWSAIFNGYDAAAMAQCPFPAIPAYLARQHFPTDAIPEAAVTHVWTQDAAASAHIAAAARIPNIAKRLDDMIGSVDAVLLARDDAENHEAHAAPFLKAGLPIYIDKPLALSAAGAARLYDLQQRPGQIFTCSALRFARELQLTVGEKAKLGALVYLDGCAPKNWDTYAIHVIEPLLAIAGTDVTAMQPSGRGDVRHLDLGWAHGAQGRITTLGTAHAPFTLRLFGKNGWRELVFSDTFAAFKGALAAFTDIVRGAAPAQDPAGPLAAIRVLEAGRNLR
jgi:predicted dehydrogenase